MAGSRPGPARRPSGELEYGPAAYLGIERTPIMRLSRSLSNRTWQTGAYQAIYRANLEIAREVQRRAVIGLKGSIVRPAQSTGTLEDAISDARAVYADALRIIVGVGDFLDAKASYWRAVEGGAPGLKGRVVYGFWTNAPRGDSSRVSVHGPRRGVKTGRPLVMSYDEPPDIANDFRDGATGRVPYFKWTIENPTEAHWYFLNAWNSVGASGFMERTYRDEFKQALGPNGKPINLNRAFRAYHGRPLLGGEFNF